MSAFGDHDPDRYDPYSGSPRDAYNAGYGYQAPAGGYGYTPPDDEDEERQPRHRRGPRVLVVAMIGALALVVIGAIAFAGSLVMSKTGKPQNQSNVAGAAASASAGDLFGGSSASPGGSDPAENATASAAPTTGGATTKPPTTKPAAPKTTVPAGASAFEMRVLTLVNEQRRAAGCGPVNYNAKLRMAAYKHSADMAKRDYFSHDTPEGVSFAARITNEGYRWSGAAENIAAGQATPESVMDAWMHSAGHKANILNCKFVDLGVGLEYQVKNGKKGTPYWTQDFGTPMR